MLASQISLLLQLGWLSAYLRKVESPPGLSVRQQVVIPMSLMRLLPRHPSLPSHLVSLQPYVLMPPGLVYTPVLLAVLTYRLKSLLEFLESTIKHRSILVVKLYSLFTRNLHLSSQIHLWKLFQLHGQLIDNSHFEYSQLFASLFGQ